MKNDYELGLLDAESNHEQLTMLLAQKTAHAHGVILDSYTPDLRNGLLETAAPEYLRGFQAYVRQAFGWHCVVERITSERVRLWAAPNRWEAALLRAQLWLDSMTPPCDVKMCGRERTPLPPASPAVVVALKRH